MTLSMDLDIINTRRPNNYDLDVMVGGEWVASAKNLHAADDTACEVWYRAVLDQPMTQADDDTPAPGIENEPPEPPVYPAPNAHAVTLQSQAIESTLQRNRICANCQGAHITWQCPQIAIILFAPPRCSTCGDPLDWQGPGLCRACREWREPAALQAA